MDKYVRIGMLTSDYLDTNHGGLENHIYFLARELQNKGHDVVVVRTSRKASIRKPPSDVPTAQLWRPEEQHQVVTRASGHLGREGAVRILRNITARDVVARIAHMGFEPDIWHQHDFLETLAVSKLLSHRQPVMWTNHLGEYLLVHRQRFGPAFLHWATSHYAHRFAPSPELATLRGWPGYFQYIKNGVDDRLFRPLETTERAAARVHLGWRDTEQVILIPRRWAPTKGVLEAVMALKVCEVRRPDLAIRIVFVGAGSSEYPSYVQQVRRVLSELSLYKSEVIDQLSPHEMVPYYQASDYTLIPSILEATSLSALEAMASGSFVIATDTGGLPELITDNSTGLMCKSGDVEDLARKLMTGFTMPFQQKDEIMNRARKQVVDLHSWSSVAEQVERAYLSRRR